jgi:hypothetical protein
MYKLHSFTPFIYSNQKKEIGSLQKNGHLFLSIFKNLDGEFYFFDKNRFCSKML